MVFGFEQRLFPEVARAAGLFGGNAVVRQLVGVDACQQFRATPDIEEALAQERTQRALVGRIHVGRRDQMGAQ